MCENEEDWAQGWKVSSSAVSGMHNGAGQASDWHMASPSHTDACSGGSRSGSQVTQDDGDAAPVIDSSVISSCSSGSGGRGQCV